VGVFDFLARKQRHIEALVSEYLDEWAACLQEFRKGMQVFLEMGSDQDLAFLSDRTHKRESQADDLRRNIEYEMYAKAVLPESRSDIMDFLESIDVVINRAESVLYIILNERIELPPSFAEDLRRLVDRSMEATDLLLALSRRMFTRNVDLFATVRAIDEKESECDHIERSLIRDVFRSAELDALQKISLRDLILKIGDISDQAQKVADRMNITSLKRRV